MYACVCAAQGVRVNLIKKTYKAMVTCQQWMSVEQVKQKRKKMLPLLVKSALHDEVHKQTISREKRERERKMMKLHHHLSSWSIMINSNRNVVSFLLVSSCSVQRVTVVHWYIHTSIKNKRSNCTLAGPGAWMLIRRAERDAMCKLSHEEKERKKKQVTSKQINQG